MITLKKPFNGEELIGLMESIVKDEPCFDKNQLFPSLTELNRKLLNKNEV